MITIYKLHTYLLIYFIQKNHFSPLRSLSIDSLIATIALMMSLLFVLYSIFTHIPVSTTPCFLFFSALALKKSNLSSSKSKKI